MKNLTRKELKKIEAIAGEEFNYTGDGSSNYDNDYIGEPGEYDFGGNGRSFAEEHAIGRTFSFTIVNGTGQDEIIALCPAYYDTLARLALEGHSDVTAIFGDGTILSRGTGNDLVCTSLNSGKTIFGLLEFVKRNPSRIVGMSIQASNASMFNKVIKVENVGPITDLGDKNIILSKYRPAQQLATDKVDMDLLKNKDVLDFNDQNLIKFPAPSGLTLNVDLFLGAIDNRPSKLKKKADMAHSNMRAKYPHLCK